MCKRALRTEKKCSALQEHVGLVKKQTSGLNMGFKPEIVMQDKLVDPVLLHKVKL
jgi:hypothetical protein